MNAYSAVNTRPWLNYRIDIYPVARNKITKLASDGAFHRFPPIDIVLLFHLSLSGTVYPSTSPATVSSNSLAGISIGNRYVHRELPPLFLISFFLFFSRRCSGQVTFYEFFPSDYFSLPFCSATEKKKIRAVNRWFHSTRISSRSYCSSSSWLKTTASAFQSSFLSQKLDT